VFDEERLLLLNHRSVEVRSISIDRHVLEACTERRVRRLCARHLEPLEVLVLLHDFDDAPIGEVTNGQLGNRRQRLFVIERSGQRDVRLGQKLPFLFNAPSLGNIYRDTE
jgi:hypothetical protein